MLDLNELLRALFENNWRCTDKWQRGCTWRFTWWRLQLSMNMSVKLRVLLMVHLTALTFEVEIKGALRLQLSCTWRSTWKSVNYCFGGAIFFKSACKGDLESKHAQHLSKKIIYLDSCLCWFSKYATYLHSVKQTNWSFCNKATEIKWTYCMYVCEINVHSSYI